jgi:molybdenum cofactor biosynthesis enzyme MoaA
MNEITPSKNNLCSKRAEKMISVKINHNCNGRCRFCVDKNGRAFGDTNVDVVCDKIFAFPQYKKVIITGGEPFLEYEKVIRLAKKLKDAGRTVILNTNGSLLDKTQVFDLNNFIDELQISIHHYNEAVNDKIIGASISFNNIRCVVKQLKCVVSINSTFNNCYNIGDRRFAINKMVGLVKELGAQNLRLTELKKCDSDEFISAGEFLNKDHPFTKRCSSELVRLGCTYYYTKSGVKVSIKRLCEHAIGKDGIAFSCCFINSDGQKKINVDTKKTFKVIYGDGFVADDWIFYGSGELK